MDGNLACVLIILIIVVGTVLHAFADAWGKRRKGGN